MTKDGVSLRQTTQTKASVKKIQCHRSGEGGGVEEHLSAMEGDNDRRGLISRAPVFLKENLIVVFTVGWQISVLE